jgi:Mg-chelatase subunit ChlD
MSSNNEITISSTKPKFTPKLSGLAARKAAVLEVAQELEPRAPEQCEHRIGIVFDDSGSMNHEQIASCHAGIEEFLRSCVRDQTAVCIYPMNAAPTSLTTNLPALAILARAIHATGSTPLQRTLIQMLSEHNLSRAIVFSDGVPDTEDEVEFARIVAFKKPVDTVYIPSAQTRSYRPYNAAREYLQKLAAATGGIFLEFAQGRSNFATAFKYLSPGLRFMLADRSFVDRLEGR